MMRSLRTLGVALALLVGCAGLSLGAVACTGEGQFQLGTPSANPPPAPPPPATPADTDKDGITDDVDKCPDKAEDNLPPDAKDGCPTTDPDKDGIAGDADKCPNEPETVNGFMDEDGCPDVAPKAAMVGNKIEIKERVMFDDGKATIKPESDKLLEDVANVIKDPNNKVEYVEVAGHADIDGTDQMNKKLTADRAKAVSEKLVKLGVDAAKLRSAGYSFYCPADGDSSKTKSEEAKAKDRRVEFLILKRDGKESDVKWGGCEAATKKGMKPAPIPASKAPASAPAGDKGSGKGGGKMDPKKK